MENLAIKASLRQGDGKKNDALRQEGLIPAVIYGHKLDNKNLVVRADNFNKIYKEAGQSSLIDLDLADNGVVKVLIQDVQYDPIKHTIIHVDFYQVRMDEEITAHIPVVYVGESPAVKNLGGVLVASLEEVEVKCLPADLVKEIAIDLGTLVEVDSKILVKDLKFGGKIEVITDPEIVVASVIEQRQEEPVSAPAEAEATPEPAIVGEEGKDQTEEVKE